METAALILTIGTALLGWPVGRAFGLALSGEADEAIPAAMGALGLTLCVFVNVTYLP